VESRALPQRLGVGDPGDGYQAVTGLRLGLGSFARPQAGGLQFDSLEDPSQVRPAVSGDLTVSDPGIPSRISLNESAGDDHDHDHDDRRNLESERPRRQGLTLAARSRIVRTIPDVGPTCTDASASDSSVMIMTRPVTSKQSRWTVSPVTRTSSSA
jgi:hypothetical protein